jgi:hypothetical protein
MYYADKKNVGGPGMLRRVLYSASINALFVAAASLVLGPLVFEEDGHEVLRHTTAVFTGFYSICAAAGFVFEWRHWRPKRDQVQTPPAA